MTQPEDDAARLARELAEVNCPFAKDAEIREDLQSEWDRCRADWIEPQIKRMLPVIRAHLAERDVVRGAASNLAARVEECVLSSNFCHAEHHCQCSYERAYYHDITNCGFGTDERRKAAEDAGCNCGMQDEHDQVEKATQELRAALSAAKSDDQTPTTTEPSQ